MKNITCAIIASVGIGFAATSWANAGDIVQQVTASDEAAPRLTQAQIVNEMHELAVTFEAGQYMLVAQPVRVYAADDMFDYSGRHVTGVHTNGDYLGEGVWLVPEHSVLVFDSGKVEVMDTPTVLASNTGTAQGGTTGVTGIGIGPIAAGGGCSVSCQDGYFACCFVPDPRTPNEYSCKCRSNGSGDSDCESGGTGSSSCSEGIGTAMVSEIEGPTTIE